MSLASALTTAVLPILVIALLGYGFGAIANIDVSPLNTITLYLLVPALVFHSLATTSLSVGAFVRVGTGVLVFVLLMIGIAELAGRVVGEREPYLSGFVLASAFPNSGNYGIPLSEFAFGDIGRATAVIYLTVQNLLVYTIGVYIASRNGGYSGTGAMREVFRLPLIYAALAALAARWLNVIPPMDSTVLSTIELLGDASIPLMLLVLGIQLAGTDIRAVSRSIAPSVLKLLIAPIIAVGIILLLGVSDPIIARTFILECATPTAIIPLMLIIEYTPDTQANSSDPTAAEYISTIIFVTTVASIVVLSVLIAILGSGWPI